MKNIVYLFLILCFFQSCIQPPEEPLKVGLPIWTPCDFFLLAEAQGYYRDHSIQLIEYSSPSEAVRAYRTGTLDAVLITNQMFIKMSDDALTDRIILVIDYSSGNDVMLADPEISAPEELMGKRIAAEASALGIFVLLRCLDMHGLNPEDITHVPIDVGDQPAAFRNGTIDGVITYEPFATRIRNMNAVELCNSKLIPFEICDLLVSTPKVIKKKQDQLQALCSGFFHATRDFNTRPGEYLSMLAERARLSEEEYQCILNGVTMLQLADNRLLFGNPDSGLAISILKVNRLMQEFGLVENQLNTQKILDNSIIEAIENENTQNTASIQHPDTDPRF